MTKRVLINQLKLIRPKFFARFKMESGVQDGCLKSKEHILGICQYFSVLFFAIIFYVSNMNRELILSNKSKIVVQSKMADKNRCVSVTMRVFNIFSISLSHEFGVKVTYFIEKTFLKKPRWRHNSYKFQPPSWILLDDLWSKNNSSNRCHFENLRKELPIFFLNFMVLKMFFELLKIL
jgi:hypothetical protein